MIHGLPSLTDADSGYWYLKLAMAFRSYYDVRRDRMLNVFGQFSNLGTLCSLSTSDAPAARIPHSGGWSIWLRISGVSRLVTRPIRRGFPKT